MKSEEKKFDEIGKNQFDEIGEKIYSMKSEEKINSIISERSYLFDEISKNNINLKKVK